MAVLPSFQVKIFKLWAIKMEGSLGSLDLWDFFQETSINYKDKNRGAIALFLIIPPLDNNILSRILHEYGEIHNATIFWDIVEMKYNVNGSNMFEESLGESTKNVIGKESEGTEKLKVKYDNEQL